MIVALLVLLLAGSFVVWNAFTAVGVPEAGEGQPPPSFSGTGSFVIGSDVVTGTYRSAGAEESCRWQVIVGGSTLQRGDGAEEVEVDLSRRLSLFRTTRCGIWTWMGD